MQPLKMLTNVQKARLLHSLLTGEIPGFIAHLKIMSDTVVSTREEITSVWKDQLFGPEFWIELAAGVQHKLNRYQIELTRSSTVFADQLFDGYTAIFTVHALTVYVAEERYSDPKFKPAVELLFG